MATSVCVSWACVFTALSGFAFTAAFLATFGFQAALAHGRFVASAGVSPPTTSRGKPLQPVQHQPLLHAATFVKFHRQPENLKWRLKNVLASLKLAAFVFRLPLFILSTADRWCVGGSPTFSGKRCATPNSTRDVVATSRCCSIWLR